MPRGGEFCLGPLSGVAVEVYDLQGVRLASPSPTDCDGRFQFSNPGKEGLILCLPAEIQSRRGVAGPQGHTRSAYCSTAHESYELCPIRYCLARVRGDRAGYGRNQGVGRCHRDVDVPGRVCPPRRRSRPTRTAIVRSRACFPGRSR